MVNDCNGCDYHDDYDDHYRFFYFLFFQEESKENNNPGNDKGSPPDQAPPPSGLMSRLAGGVYSKTATVVGGVTWVAGTAVSTTYGVMKGAGGYVNIWKKKEKDKSD